VNVGRVLLLDILPALLERVGGQHQVPAGGGGRRDETVSEEVHYLVHATAEL
jgi:hypothetical protein